MFVIGWFFLLQGGEFEVGPFRTIIRNYAV